MDAEGLPYGERTMTYNSRLAQELGKWADTQPGGEALHDALFRAYFVEARDISQPAVLLEIAERWACRSTGRARCWRSGRSRPPSTRTGSSRASTASPACRRSSPARYGVVGAQPYEALEELVRRAAQPPDAERVDASRDFSQGVGGRGTALGSGPRCHRADRGSTMRGDRRAHPSARGRSPPPRGHARRALAHSNGSATRYAIRSDTPVGLAILERRPVHVRDCAPPSAPASAGCVELRLYSDRVRTILVVPLLRDGVALGGILIRRTRARPFTASRSPCSRAFADQAAIAIENARLSRSSRPANRELTEALEQQRATAEILGVIAGRRPRFSPCWMRWPRMRRGCAGPTRARSVSSRARSSGSWRISDRRAHTARRAARWIGRIVGGRAIRSGDPSTSTMCWPSTRRIPASRALQALSGDRTVLAVPLLREGAAIGAIVIRRDRGSSVHRQADRAARDLRRPGGDRHRERPPVRGAGGRATAS